MKIAIRSPEKEIVERLKLAATLTMSRMNRFVSVTVREKASSAMIKMPKSALLRIPSLNVIYARLKMPLILSTLLI